MLSILKSAAKGVMPPFAWYGLRLMLRMVGLVQDPPKKDDDALFGGDDVLFKSAFEGATVYGEYGVGASTIWVAEQHSIPMIGVDSSREWIDHVSSRIENTDWHPRYVDIGPLANWGYPKCHAMRHNYGAYSESLWDGDLSPDLVLVDGRFRVACFLTTLLRAAPGTKIIFDDYADRPLYHLVEEFCPPSARSYRQALFVVPHNLDRAAIEKTRDAFTMVID